MYSHFRHGIPILGQGGLGSAQPSFVTHPDQFSDGIVQPVQPYLNELQQYIGSHTRGEAQIQIAQLNCLASIWTSLVQTYSTLLTDAQKQNPFALESVRAMVRKDVREMSLSLHILADIQEEYHSEYVQCNYCHGSGKGFFSPCRICRGHGILFVKGGRAFALS